MERRLRFNCPSCHPLELSPATWMVNGLKKAETLHLLPDEILPIAHVSLAQQIQLKDLPLVKKF
jgi:hypothetical protein